MKRRRQPQWLAPMLATLTDKHFSDPDWVFERKLDGVRCLAFRDGASVRLMSRNKNDISGSWPEIVAALAKQKSRDFIVDGEIVAFDGKATSFSRLQARLGVRAPSPALLRSVPAVFFVFDLLHAGGEVTTKLPLLERKERLARLLSFDRKIRFTTHRKKDGERFLDAACLQGWEGLIAKKADAPYVSRRSRDWLKFKCVGGQELVIGGWSDPQGARGDFGALLVGTYEGGKLNYAGKVGSGYSVETLRSLGAKLKRLARSTCPFRETPRIAGAHWVKPELVANFAFTEWTGDGKLRHPRFLGLRNDKKAASVRREKPKA